MSRPEILRRGDDPASFDALIESADFPTLDRREVDFARHYYTAVRGAAMMDTSFAVMDGGRPAGVVICDVTAGRLSNVHIGLAVDIASDVDEAHRVVVLKAAFDGIDRLVAEHDVGDVRVTEPGLAGEISGLGQLCVARQGIPTLLMWANADLSVDEAVLSRNVRKSYKSLINWGRRELTLRYVNAETPDRSLYDAFKQLHFVVAGRETRSQASWDAAFEWIERGHAELALGYMQDGALVAGTMFRDGDSTSRYTTGAYDRSKFDKPLSHWPVFDAMLRAKARGCRHAELGAVPAHGAVDAKEYQIGQFKKGLTGRLRSTIEWSWSPGARRSPSKSEQSEAEREFA